MAILKIIQYPDKLLRRKGRYVTDLNLPQVQQEIADMLTTLQAYKTQCAALAATQLGIPDPYNIIVLNPIADEPELFIRGPLVLINPRVKAHSELKIKMLEGCVSIAPKLIQAAVWRPAEVTLSALSRTGQPIKLVARGFLARCLQHECDHLKGKLYIDYLSQKERDKIERAINRDKVSS